MACRMGNFLLPPHYAQHKHAWVPVAMGVRLCALCGAEHVCFRGECEEVCSSYSKSYTPQSHSCPPLSVTIAAPQREPGVAL